MEYLSFESANFHSSNPSDSEEASKTKSSVKSNLLCVGVLSVKCREMFIFKFFIDVLPGNRCQASSENRTQGGKTDPE